MDIKLDGKGLRCGSKGCLVIQQVARNRDDAFEVVWLPRQIQRTEDVRGFHITSFTTDKDTSGIFWPKSSFRFLIFTLSQVNQSLVPMAK